MVDTAVIPHADKVITHNESVQCYCGDDIAREGNYLGQSNEPALHVGWKCDDCGLHVAELLDQ